MSRSDSPATDESPNQPVRHFDVFAEYTRQERREKGYPEDEAKGYGIWLAKVVASRRFGQKSPAESTKPAQQRDRTEEEPKFRSMGDELQTDETFDHDIIERMGARFYAAVFVLAIAAARDEGKTYETIRDTIRRGWKPLAPHRGNTMPIDRRYSSAWLALRRASAQRTHTAHHSERVCAWGVLGAGSSSHVRPSSIRPPASGVRPPHYL